MPAKHLDEGRGAEMGASRLCCLSHQDGEAAFSGWHLFGVRLHTCITCQSPKVES